MAFPGELWSQRSVVQIKINSIWIRQAMRFVLHLIFEVEHNGAGIGGRPMPDSGDARHFRRFLRSKYRCWLARSKILTRNVVGAGSAGSRQVVLKGRWK